MRTVITMTTVPIRKGVEYILRALLPSLDPQNQRGENPDWDPGLRIRRSLTQPVYIEILFLYQALHYAVKLRPFSPGVRKGGRTGTPDLHTSPAFHSARARLRLPQGAEAHRPCGASVCSRSPRFCPRSTAYGRLLSDGSAGLGASACLTKRLHKSKHSHHHTTRSIFPGS